MEGYIPPKKFRKIYVILRHLWTHLWKKFSCGFENFKNALNLDARKIAICAEISTSIFSKYFFRSFLAWWSLLGAFHRFCLHNFNFGKKLGKWPKKIPQVNFWHSPLGAVVQKFLHDPEKKLSGDHLWAVVKSWSRTNNSREKKRGVPPTPKKQNAFMAATETQSVVLSLWFSRGTDH